MLDSFLAVSFSLLLAAAVTGEPPPLSFAARGIEQCAEHGKRLRDGEVVYIEQRPTGGEGVALTACGVVDAPPAEVWPVLRDCEDYEYFLPGVERSTLQSRTDNVALCEALIDLPFPLGELRSVERVTETPLAGGGFERRWSLERGNYQRLEGSWTLRPWGSNAESTLAVYQLDMDPETVIPDFLLRRAQSSTSRDLFAAIRERVRHCRNAPAAKDCPSD